MSKKTTKKPKEEMTLWERINDYTVLSEEIVDGFKLATLRTHSGAIVNCRIPIHTKEEERELGAKLAVQLTRMACPDLDLSQCELIRIVQ